MLLELLSLAMKLQCSSDPEWILSGLEVKAVFKKRAPDRAKKMDK